MKLEVRDLPSHKLLYSMLTAMQRKSTSAKSVVTVSGAAAIATVMERTVGGTATMMTIQKMIAGTGSEIVRGIGRA